MIDDLIDNIIKEILDVPRLELKILRQTVLVKGDDISTQRIMAISRIREAVPSDKITLEHAIKITKAFPRDREDTPFFKELTSEET